MQIYRCGGPPNTSFRPLGHTHARPTSVQSADVALAQEMPLQQVMQALQETPATEAQTRAVLAYIAARWQLGKQDDANAVRTMGLALEAMPNLRPAMRVLYRIYSRAQDIRSALFHLGEITGEVTTDDLLENIFSKFCIGK